MLFVRMKSWRPLVHEERRDEPRHDLHRRRRTASYVLVTPARNEAAFIEETIRSVIAQTVRPLKWVIVSDGSTDGTDEIVQNHTAQHHWIELVRMPERMERDFAGKVYAFNAGYQRAEGARIRYYRQPRRGHFLRRRDISSFF